MTTPPIRSASASPLRSASVVAPGSIIRLPVFPPMGSVPISTIVVKPKEKQVVPAEPEPNKEVIAKPESIQEVIPQPAQETKVTVGPVYGPFPLSLFKSLEPQHGTGYYERTFDPSPTTVKLGRLQYILYGQASFVLSPLLLKKRWSCGVRPADEPESKVEDETKTTPVDEIKVGEVCKIGGEK